jgi:hypothetical protein
MVNPSDDNVSAMAEDVRRALDELQLLFLHVGVQILQELRELQKRPEGSVGSWAEEMRRRHRSQAGMLGSVVVLSVDRGGWDKMSAEEKEVQSGRVQRLLIRLAITGRIDEQEYNSFVRRLRGN